jgi:TonB family protein
MSATAETGKPGAGQRIYENSDSGLKHLIQDALTAGKADDVPKLLEIANSMMLRSPEDWFSRVFGPDMGRIYARSYTESSERTASNLAGLFSTLGTEKYSILEVHQFKNSCDFKADQDEYPVLAKRLVEEPFSVVRFSEGNLVRSLRFIVYVDGGFRFLGLLNIPAGQSSTIQAAAGSQPDPNSPPAHLVVSQDVQMAKILHRVTPIYPENARYLHVEGKVVLDVTIDKDGTIESMRVVRGQCPFVESAEAAVKQWRFGPTLLQGQPIQVEAVFEIRFQSNAH